MADKTPLYWDSCIFYEWLGDEPVTPEKFEGVQEVLTANEKGENIVVTSTITHLEVLPRKLADKGASDEQDYLSLFDAEHFHEIELSTNILLRAREIRDYYYSPLVADGGYKMMDLGDCIHLATASIYGAAEFHTRDKDRKGSKVPLLKLYELSGSPRLCGKYDLKIVSPEAEQPSLDLRHAGTKDPA